MANYCSCGFTIRKRSSCRTHRDSRRRYSGSVDERKQNLKEKSNSFNSYDCKGRVGNQRPSLRTQAKSRDALESTRNIVNNNTTEGFADATASTGESNQQPSKRGCSYTVYHFDANFNAVDNSGDESDDNMKTKSGKKPIRIHLIEDESILLVFEAKATVQELFDQVCSLLSIKDSKFFGLSTIVENEHRFMDLTHKLCKYASKDWSSSSESKKSNDHKLVPQAYLVVQFQVQFYVEHPRLISDKETRTQYYLQMKKNVLLTKVTTQDEILFSLAAYALQSDLGQFDPSKHNGHYFDAKKYFPLWYLERWGLDYLYTNLPHLHKELGKMSQFESQAEYIKKSSNIDDVPIHYYKLYKTKREVCPSVVIGVFHKGIRIHHGAVDKRKGKWKLEFEFTWNKVSRLFFAGKRFEIYPEDVPEDRKLVYFTGSHSRSKYLLRFLSSTHSLYMSLSPHAQHLKRVDGKLQINDYRESYVNGDDINDDRNSVENETKKPQVTQKSFMSHYTSTTSHGSSRTSGIESDSKQLTEKEDDDEEDDDEGSTSDLGYVNVTERELSLMPSKCISVHDLIEVTNANADDEKFKQECEMESGLNSSVKSIVEKSCESTPTSGTPVAFMEENIETTPKRISVVQTESKETKSFNTNHHIQTPAHETISLHSSSVRSHGMSTVSADNSVLTTQSEGRQRKSESRIDKSKLLWLAPRSRASAQTFYDDTHTVPRNYKSKSAADVLMQSKPFEPSSPTKPTSSSPSKHRRSSKTRPRSNTTTSSTTKTQRHTKASTFRPVKRAVSTEVSLQNDAMSNLTNSTSQTSLRPSGVHTLNKTTLTARDKSSSVQRRHKENHPKPRPHSYYVTSSHSRQFDEDFKPLNASNKIMKSLEDLSNANETTSGRADDKTTTRTSKQTNPPPKPSRRRPSDNQKTSTGRRRSRSKTDENSRTHKHKTHKDETSKNTNVQRVGTIPHNVTSFHDIQCGSEGVLV